MDLVITKSLAQKRSHIAWKGLNIQTKSKFSLLQFSWQALNLLAIDSWQADSELLSIASHVI